jgi:hypothetical protein
MFRWSAFALLVCLCLSSRVASADVPPGHVSLRWSAPDECPDDVQLVHQVEALLGESLLGVSEQSLSAHVLVRGSVASGYAAKLEFTSAQGDDERHLEHPSCDKLLEAVALVVALAIDPERVRATQLAHDASTAPAEGVPAITKRAEKQLEPALVVAPLAHCVSEAKPADPPRTTQNERLRGLRIGLHGTLGAGPLPGFGAGVQASLGWQRPEFRAELLGRYWAPRQQAVSLTPSVALDLSMASLGVRACWLPGISKPWRLAACAGADLGQERATGAGVENEHTATARYTDVAGSVQVAYARSRLMPEGGFEVSGALERPRFGIVENGSAVQIFQPAGWAFVAFLGLAFEL